jgi:phosphatidate cytidylyltransferase
MNSRRNPAWQDLGIRVASAAILTPLSLFVIWWGGEVWAAWLALLAVLMGAEWVGLCGVRLRSEAGSLVPLGLLAAGIIHITVRSGPMASSILFLIACAVLLWMAAKPRTLGAGLVYIGPAFLCLLDLRDGPAGFRNLLYLAAVVWAGDIGAYLVGRLVGGPRMAPKISPGKTWSGAVGGLAVAALAGAAAGYEAPLTAALLALILSVIAQAGDLLESAIKRHFGVKDSGNLIPGHGGLLDRLDGVLTAAPAAMLWSFWIGPHAMLWMVAP